MNPRLIRIGGAINTWVYRLTGGLVGGHFPSGAPVLLLTTTGRKSGARRTTPLLYVQDGEDFVVVGSQGGAPTHPAWYLNLKQDPRAEIEIGRRRVPVEAREAGEDERDALMARMVAIYHPFEDYQHATTRRIPVLRLSPR